MTEEIRAYARQIVEKSCQVKQGELVMISLLGLGGLELVDAIQDELSRIGADCILYTRDTKMFKKWIINASEKAMELEAQSQTELVRKADVYIGLNAQENAMELGDIPREKMFAFVRSQKELVAERTRRRNLACMVPTPAMAQVNQMSTDAFSRYFFGAVTYDFDRQRQGLAALQRRMEQAEAVRITAPDTDLTMKLGKIPVIVCDGKANLPDGEVFTAPVVDSVQGTIRFNAPSTYRGRRFENVCLTFRDGKVVEASANDPMIHQILDTDPGCRFLGEFAVGTNPMVTQPMANVLFDEKLCGSIHLALGDSYPFADNGNKAGIHWDLVLMMQPERGGGQLYFDGELIMDNGRFLPPDLQELNSSAQG